MGGSKTRIDLCPSIFDISFVMKLRNGILAIAGLLSFFTRSSYASALTTAIGPNQRVCFYAEVDKVGEKMGVSTHDTSSIDLIIYV